MYVKKGNCERVDFFYCIVALGAPITSWSTIADVIEIDSCAGKTVIKMSRVCFDEPYIRVSELLAGAVKEILFDT